MVNNLNENKLNEDDLKIINLSLDESRAFKTINDVELLSKNDIMNLIEKNLSGLIGYDKDKGDIDDLGEKADNVISKLLILLRKRGDM